MGIVINHSENIFLLQTRSNSYAFGIDDQGMVRHLYWGKRINEVEDFELPVLTEVSQMIRFTKSQDASEPGEDVVLSEHGTRR